jgi:membrane protease YdiL (CAAX protease family)
VNKIKKIFISPSETRLRAGWRILIQTIAMGVILACVLVPLVFYPDFINTGAGLLLSQISELFAVTLSIFFARRLLDKRTFSSLGLKIDRVALIDISVGIGITFLMMGFVYLLELSMGWLTITGFAWTKDPVQIVISQTLFYLFAYILVGWNEELLSRGYHLQNLASGLNIKWAVILASAVFGFLHIGNPNATWTGIIGIFLAGVFLAYGYLRTHQLWLPIGLHIGWNFFEGVVFGFPVSGTTNYTLIDIVVKGPKLWTGGSFGPEAGLVVIPALLLGSTLVYVYTKGRDGYGSQEIIQPEKDRV